MAPGVGPFPEPQNSGGRSHRSPVSSKELGVSEPQRPGGQNDRAGRSEGEFQPVVGCSRFSEAKILRRKTGPETGLEVHFQGRKHEFSKESPLLKSDTSITFKGMSKRLGLPKIFQSPVLDGIHYRVAL